MNATSGFVSVIEFGIWLVMVKNHANMVENRDVKMWLASLLLSLRVPLDQNRQHSVCYPYQSPLFPAIILPHHTLLGLLGY
jgi:hypothetical protein